MDKRTIIPMLVITILTTSPSLCAYQPKELTIYAAASLTGAFSEIGRIYEKETGISVAFNFDGSQVLRTQIENGAYADIFASANTKQLNALKKEGYLDNSTIFTFTKNKPALIVPEENPAGLHNISDLAKPGIKIILGTKDVPIGDYTVQILDRMAKDPAYGPEFKARVLAKVASQETNANYIVSKVALGEADAGVSYKSDVTDALSSKITKIEIPEKYNIVADYPIAILKESKYSNESKAFLDLVESEKGRAVLEKYGFDPVTT